MATFDNIAQEKSKVKVCDRCHQEAPLKTIRVRRIERTDGNASLLRSMPFKKQAK